MNLVEGTQPRARHRKRLAERVDFGVRLVQSVFAGRQRCFDFGLALRGRGLAAAQPNHPRLALSALLCELDLSCAKRLQFFPQTLEACTNVCASRVVTVENRLGACHSGAPFR